MEITRWFHNFPLVFAVDRVVQWTGFGRMLLSRSSTGLALVVEDGILPKPAQCTTGSTAGIDGNSIIYTLYPLLREL
jgi:hypothetical protein